MIIVDPVYPLNTEVVYGEVPLLITSEQVLQTKNFDYSRAEQNRFGQYL